jgi:hypothetical protein
MMGAHCFVLVLPDYWLYGVITFNMGFTGSGHPVNAF